MRIGIFGANGRMGDMLIKEVSKREGLVLSAVFGQNLSTEFVEKMRIFYKDTYIASDIRDFVSHCEYIIDFSAPEGSIQLVRNLDAHIKGVVIGTTGFTKADFDILSKRAKSIPILWSSNMSRGVAMLNKLIALTSKILDDADIEIVEIHHNQKKDAPSGTALSLAKTCAQARGLDLESVRVSSRDGQTCVRTRSEIGVMSLRGGDVVGRHSVGFYTQGEYIELVHNATNRLVFAKGALDALLWLSKQKPSRLYEIGETLEF